MGVGKQQEQLDPGHQRGVAVLPDDLPWSWRHGQSQLDGEMPLGRYLCRRHCEPEADLHEDRPRSRPAVIVWSNFKPEVARLRVFCLKPFVPTNPSVERLQYFFKRPKFCIVQPMTLWLPSRIDERI